MSVSQWQKNLIDRSTLSLYNDDYAPISVEG